MSMHGGLWMVVLGSFTLPMLCPAIATSARGAESETGSRKYLQISGIYPHLATHNQPADPADRPQHGECGTGAIVPWAGRLWYITYPQHKTTGSQDKLYEVDEQMNRTIRPESVGGTHACRMIHRESQQLIIGPYFIDAQRRVRAVDLQKLRGRMTAVMRHLSDPANKVYFFDMEGRIYEVDVRSLEVRELFRKPVPGWHGKGGYTGQGRVVIANNGEAGSVAAYKDVLVGGPATGEEAGILAEWDGKEWRIVERKQFTDVTGPGGIHGNPDEASPLWAMGWDKRSVILKLLDQGKWHTYRLPKASHTYDPRHGWYTEWPRIRPIAPRRPMMCTHGSMWDFPITFSASNSAGIRPLCSHLRVIPDFGYWNDRVVIGADDASMMDNPMCGQGQSNLWFGRPEELAGFGPRAGWGGVWMADPVRPGEASLPYLFAGYDQRIVHLTHNAAEAVRFTLELDRAGDGSWEPYHSLAVPPEGYEFHIFPRDLAAEWIRVRADRRCSATAYFHYWSPRTDSSEPARFDALADAGAPANYAGGIIRPAAHNRSLQWLAAVVSPRGEKGAAEYVEVDLQDADGFAFHRPAESREREVLEVAAVRQDFQVDEASVIVRDGQGQRYRLPKGPAEFDTPFPTGWPRAVRECASERFLANIHGTFYEIPRGAGAPDFRRIKPVCSHRKLIADFCSWRGLLVLCGTRLGPRRDGQFFADQQHRGLWFGALDDLWKLGKPAGRGGPWLRTPVRAGEPSDPYLLTGYDRKRLQLAHDADADVAFRVDIDFDHSGFHAYQEITVPRGKVVRRELPQGFHAHWIRFLTDKPCRATAQLTYD